MRQIMHGGFGVIGVVQRDTALDPHTLARVDKPTLVLIGDDDHASTGRAGWRCANTLTAWAKFAMVHAAGATAESYGQAAEAARLIGAAALVETDIAHAWEWARAFDGKPGLIILPREGVHPVGPARERLQ